MKRDRRDFVKSGGFLGATSLLAKAGLATGSEAKPASSAEEQPDPIPYRQNEPENMIFTTCLGCNTGCPIKVKIQEGTVVKVDGNPYTPWTRVPHLPFETPIRKAAAVEGAICPKGQAGLFAAYDPYRVKKVLKRDGPRGSMRFKTIDFQKAVEEIVNGGTLFAHVPGEENRHVEGLSSLFALRDPKLAAEMGSAVDEIWAAKTPEEKRQKVARFKERFKDQLHLLIDPDHPDLGPRNNQLLWVHGRLKAGRQEFFTRFVKEGLGSVNFHGHTTVCQGSLYFAGKAMSEQFGFDEKKRQASWHGGEKFFWQGDQSGAEFMIFVGSSPFEANYPPLRTPHITTGLTSGRLKFAVVDPRLSKTAAKAWKWIPAKPGTEGALAFGMIRWILDHGRHDARYLANANKAAAKADGEPTFCNATWLVKVKDGQPGELLRASDLGLPTEKRTQVVKEESIAYDLDRFVVLSKGAPVAFDPNDETTEVHGDLLVDTELGGIRVKSALALLTEEASGRTIEEWAGVCGIAKGDIAELAREFTSHGKRAVADIHRGVSQHTNGFTNCLAWNALNLLIGNYDWRGGSVKAATYDVSGGKAQGPFDFKHGMHPGRAKPFGLGILRERNFEETTLFAGKYPAPRPWFPNATDVYQELLPSVGSGYPYPVKALLLYMGTPGYSLPAGHTQLKVLADTEKLPLFVASDIVIGESSMYADYIIPDLSFYERWEFHGSHPNNIWKVQPVRQPAIAPIPDTVKVFGEEMPISLEAFMLGVAEKMGVSGFGPDGFGPGQHFARPEDFYLRMVANLGWGEKQDGSDGVAEASAEELEIFQAARRHLPRTVFDAERWRATVGPHWRRVVTVLNRGGRFQDYEKAFDGEQVKNKYGKLINLYCEKVAKTKDSMTGRPVPGTARHVLVADSLGRPLAIPEGDLHLITYREIFHSKSRTPGNPWLGELFPENFILINSRDARRLGVRTGDVVRVVSASNPEGAWDLPILGKKPMVGKLRVSEGLRPGVIAFSLGHGHWAYGASDTWIDGEVIRGDPRRAKGIHANAAMAVDPHLGDVCLEDLVGGSVSFYDSAVRLVKEPRT
ncbi:MAG: molybdopterin-dependent oxidoreductase [Deltaproteobacteria bacterium]|nr:molybdopterin-dependent oxidoreductase [Deltaproteobacteria bacterium]